MCPAPGLSVPGGATPGSAAVGAAGQTLLTPVATADSRLAGDQVGGRCVVFLHAHPDDEAIFTAATMHRLAAQGARVVLVTATAGELGPTLQRLRRGETLAGRRRTELERACEVLGVARLVLLGHRDSGMPGWAANHHPDALHQADQSGLARMLADLCLIEGAEALVHYDGGGIYGHPDHVAVHRIGTRAARLAGICDYQATVDRDHLGGRGGHLVERAAATAAPLAGASPAGLVGRAVARAAPDVTPGSAVLAVAIAAGAIPPAAARTVSATAPGKSVVASSRRTAPPRAAGTARPAVGRPGAEIVTTVVAGRGELLAKRAAMAAHASQIPASALRRGRFAHSYGQEWYLRDRTPGVLDLLAPAVRCPAPAAEPG